MGRKVGLVISLLVLIGCKKAEERSCFKSLGDESELIQAIPESHTFELGKGLEYRLYQDSTNQIIIRGGSNMITQVEIEQTDSSIRIVNKNTCNFLRKKGDEIVVEIHSADYHFLYGQPTDSVVCMDTIIGDSLLIEFDNGAGSADFKVNLDFLRLYIRDGAGDFHVSGIVNNKSDLILKRNAYGDARDLICPYYFLHSRTTGDLHVNMNGASADIVITGTGDVYYTGSPGSLNFVNMEGDGEFIAE